MDPPLTTSQPPPQPPPPITYADSSPRSRATDHDDPFRPNIQPAPPKLRLMCSYGGHIVPRLHDKTLCYVGGDTRMVVIDRISTLTDLLTCLSKTLLTNNSNQISLKYQLPNEDLDSLITVSTDEDLDNMIDEYDRLSKPSGNNNGSKSGRIRLFLFESRMEGAQSMGPILDGSNRSEDWFLNALNGAAELQRGFSEPNSVNRLHDHDLDVLNPEYVNNSNSSSNNNISNLVEKKPGGANHDVQSTPDSPIIGTTSSFGSTSSPPSFANLPHIRVHVDQRVGIEEQFAQMGVTTGVGGGGTNQVQKQADEGFTVISSPASAAMVSGFVGGGEFASRLYSDDERSDHGGYRNQQQVTAQQQMGVLSSQSQQKQQQQQTGGELPSPDSVSSDCSLSNAIARQKPGMYQESSGQSSSGNNRSPSGMQDYAYHPQYEQHQQQMLQRHQHQQQQQQQHHQQQQQHLLQQQQQQQQQHGQTQPQYMPSGGHYVQHNPSGSMPMPGYYPFYPSQQPRQHPNQYPVYYVQAGQGQGYSLPGQQQPSMGEAPTSVPSSRTQVPTNPTIMNNSSAYNPPTRNMNMVPPKSEVGPGVYRTVTAPGGPQLVQLPLSQQQTSVQSQPQQQQQFVGYSQNHHPSLSVAPNSGYGYDFSDPAHSQMYYTQPLASGLPSQYQGVKPGGPIMMMSPDSSSQVSNDKVNAK